MESLVAGLCARRCSFIFGGELDGFQIGADGFVPRAHTGENVRGHVVGMSRSGGYFRVQAGRAETLFGERRIVIAMNDVVGYTGVMRLLRKNRFEDLSTFALVGEGFVRFGRGNG